MKKIIIPLCALLFVSLTTLGESRSWTQAATGKKLEGEFIKMKDEKTAIIKFASGEKPVPLSMLSKEDQEFIAKQAAPAPDPGAAPGDAKKEAPAKKGALPTGEVTFVMSGTHMCCSDCEELAEKSVENDKLNFADATAIKIVPSKKDKTITVTAPNGKEAMTALSGLMQAGFYGKTDHDVIKVRDIKPDDFVSDVMNVRDIHICCSKTERIVKKAVEGVKGVDETTLKEGSKSFKVSGKSFKPTEIMQALRDLGYGGSYR